MIKAFMTGLNVMSFKTCFNYNWKRGEMLIALRWFSIQFQLHKCVWYLNWRFFGQSNISREYQLQCINVIHWKGREKKNNNAISHGVSTFLIDEWTFINILEILLSYFVSNESFDRLLNGWSHQNVQQKIPTYFKRLSTFWIDFV